MRDSFAPIEAVLKRLAHKASKEVPTKSGAKMACKGGVESYEHSFLYLYIISYALTAETKRVVS